MVGSRFKQDVFANLQETFVDLIPLSAVEARKEGACEFVPERFASLGRNRIDYSEVKGFKSVSRIHSDRW